MRSFTLIELIIVIIIIGILATFAMPAFMVTKEKALTKEAIVNLKLIAAAEKIWRMESATNAYRACQCLCAGIGATCCDNNPNGCNFQLRLTLTTQNWTYWVTAVVGPPSTFIAYAQRQGGPYSACRYRITQAQDNPVVAVGPCP